MDPAFAEVPETSQSGRYQNVCARSQELGRSRCGLDVLVGCGMVADAHHGAPAVHCAATTLLIYYDQPIVRQLSKELQFLTVLHTRDGQFELIAQVRRIAAYHENLKNRLQRLLNSAFGEAIDHEQLINQINSELARVLKFESDVKGRASIIFWPCLLACSLSSCSRPDFIPTSWPSMF
jgi:hypothetical protein